ncbi:hypothetical protein ACHAWF_010189 [Thalassiosira exigua]
MGKNMGNRNALKDATAPPSSDTGGDVALRSPSLPSLGSSRRLRHRRGAWAHASSPSSLGGSGGGDGLEGALALPSKEFWVPRRRPLLAGRVVTRAWLVVLGAALLICTRVFLSPATTWGDGDEGGGNRAGPGSPPKAMGHSSVRRPGMKTQGRPPGEPGAKSGVPVMDVELPEARMTVTEAQSHELAPIAPHSVDDSQYTIRINTWRRNEQLLLSLNYHATCPGVAEIHVIWCDDENDPPDDIVRHPSGKVKVERHDVNSLNERFRVLVVPPTLGVLSLDDDVLAPCVVLDAGFVRWTRRPERMVGFDARRHVEDNGPTWKYGTTIRTNWYTISLTRAAFLHRDYLNLYTDALPREIYAYVARNFQCEDVAMSFFVSHLTGGKPPLLADRWAAKSLVQLYSERRISWGSSHQSARDKCVDDFATTLGLKNGGLQKGILRHEEDLFQWGDDPENWDDIDPLEMHDGRLLELAMEMRELRQKSGKEQTAWLETKIAGAMVEAKRTGMIEGTKEWLQRWGVFKSLWNWLCFGVVLRLQQTIGHG